MLRKLGYASASIRPWLAALQTQTEAALRDRDPDSLRRALLRLNASTRRTSRLANQLLAIAQVSPEPGARPPREPFDLAGLAAEVTRDWVPAALERKIDLGFEALEAPVMVLGQSVLLGEALKNLIDNALRHAPDGGHVTVRVCGGAVPGSRLCDECVNGDRQRGAHNETAHNQGDEQLSAQRAKRPALPFRLFQA